MLEPVSGMDQFNLLESSNFRNRTARSSVEHDLLGKNSLIANGNPKQTSFLCPSLEPRMPTNQFGIL